MYVYRRGSTGNARRQVMVFVRNLRVQFKDFDVLPCIDLNFAKGLSASSITGEGARVNRLVAVKPFGETVRRTEDVRFCFFQRRIKQNEDVRGDKRGNIIPQCGRYT